MKSSTIQKRTKKPIVTMLWVAGLGWIVLLGWALSLWMRFDFESALATVRHLSALQSGLVVQFDNPARLMHAFSNWQPAFPTTTITNQLTSFAIEHGIQLNHSPYARPSLASHIF